MPRHAIHSTFTGHMPTCAFLSFRLGVPDGVSIVAGSWRRCFSTLGWETITIAGEGPVDRVIPWLAIDTKLAPDAAELESALDGVDVVVVENLLTIPLNLPASRATMEVLRGRPAILHHHDPPWQRERFAHVTELPPTDPSWLHVTINKMTEWEFAVRGISTTTILNGFDVPNTLGDRRSTREALGLGDDDILVAHPVRAIARKNISMAIGLAERLGATYWLTGQPDEGYDDVLERLFLSARCPIIHRSVADVGVAIDDLYAAADIIAFPSTWEGFGNPLIEAAMHLRPVAVGSYPVLDELQELGLRWIPIEDFRAIRAEIDEPDMVRRRQNRKIAEHELSMEALRGRLEALLDQAGWTP